MFDHKHYVPILKWRMGEYQALHHLTPAVREWVTPLIEVPKETWDFELGAPSKTLDEHLFHFGKRLCLKWGKAPCFVDSCYIAADTMMASGAHHMGHIFELARLAGAAAIPVTGLRRSASYQAAVASIIGVDRRGVCLRLNPQDLNDTVIASIQRLLALLGLMPEEVHLVLDVGTDLLKNATGQAAAWQAMITGIPFASRYATLTVASSAIPATFSAAALKTNKYIARDEWIAYKALTNLKMPRIPTFGDYGVLNPSMVEMDPRFIDPNAKIKYATEKSWFIALGTQVRRNGRGQYGNLSQEIINETPPIFGGPAYCYGDAFISACASGGSTGGTSTWPTVTTNRHLTVSVREIASHFGLPAPV
ncbi:Beta protein [Luteibacter sp. UNC138MFCol5.1]|uniref:beta family protein n=1 Tax=Luteibacter sp. UNC138MFCol5.1 TaxID=1502774 RepID=UPI0008BAB775|nr:beta family protein [Luteibacter sp. UNC138MFCol5.1]SEP09032.1 Beta protein [Luteibacter sp. UNC138MFCol5.1]